MSYVTFTSNMNLPLPIPGQEPGDDYAFDQNSAFTIVDSHDHSSGKGVPITPDGLNISSDLPFLENNATQLRSARFTTQLAPLNGVADLDCVYVSGVDLYYNDGNGNQVRITQSGGVAGSPGSISNLASPASASYVSADSTFVWESDSSTPANMDGGSVIIREVLANAKGITLASPPALAADYTITFPSALPASQKIATLDASGNLTAPYTVDNSTLEIAANLIKVKAGGIGTTQLADGSVTYAKLAWNGNIVTTSSCGTFSRTSSSFGTVTNLSTSITTVGGRVQVTLEPAALGLYSSLSATNAGGNAQAFLQVLRGVTIIAGYTVQTSGTSILTTPPSLLCTDSPGVAGTYTYSVQLAALSATTTTAGLNNVKLRLTEVP